MSEDLGRGLNADYSDSERDRICHVIYQAIAEINTGSSAGEKVVPSGPTCDALLLIAAYLISSSPDFQTESSIETFAQGAGALLRAEIPKFQADPKRAKALGIAIDYLDLN